MKDLYVLAYPVLPFSDYITSGCSTKDVDKRGRKGGVDSKRCLITLFES